MSQHRIRYLLADEVGLGKTIEAGLILRELKLRGMARRILVVAPKGLVRQWQAEMRLHFGEKLQFIDPAELAAFRQWRNDEENLWRLHDQVICSLDSVKPIEGRRGWSLEQAEQLQPRALRGPGLGVVGPGHHRRVPPHGRQYRSGGPVQAGAALAEAASRTCCCCRRRRTRARRTSSASDAVGRPGLVSRRRQRHAGPVRPHLSSAPKSASRSTPRASRCSPRVTRLQAVAWRGPPWSQQRLYEAVTDYVRHGYNQALAAKQRHIGFLMILMQRLVTSSTAAIRNDAGEAPGTRSLSPAAGQPVRCRGDGRMGELDGQSPGGHRVQAAGWAQEKAEVDLLLNLARETEAQGTDAKAEALLELIYKLQQEENDPALKVLVFTEFVPTQACWQGFLESRGFSIALLNGSMDLDARARRSRRLAGKRVLISTDVGGEGLNLQFCHVIVNFDMPWNPMRLEQRIGRVDRIGQKHVVRAINFVLEDTVEHRVRQVLEEKSSRSSPRSSASTRPPT